MQELARSIDRARLAATFIELARINSPSFEERPLGEVLAKKLEGAGCRVVFQDYALGSRSSFNLIAQKKGTYPDSLPLLLSAHMDTIEPTEGIVIAADADTIRTAGPTVLGADDKSALAQIVEAVTVLNEHALPHGDIEIVFTSAEERGLVGAKRLDRSLVKSRHALVLDSSGSVGRLITAAPTQYTYEMRITGRAAHAGIEPERGLNALRVAAEIISALPDGRIDAETTANVGMVSGGTATNVVPKEALLKGEFRSHNPGTLERLKGTIFATARRIAAERGALLSLTEQEEYRAFRIDEQDPFFLFMKDIYRACGIEPVAAATGGGSDANVFNSHGITAINLSNGMQNVHSTEERISLADLFDGCRLVLSAIITFGGCFRKDAG